jgi:hypothetical protein
MHPSHPLPSSASFFLFPFSFLHVSLSALTVMSAEPILPDPSPNEKVSPQEAQGAQIPLANFTLPNFPPEANGLRALTLTSDIKVDEYQDELSKPFSISPLPGSIESLTLELFSLGYPPGFLTALAERLPNLKSLVIYSQLFAGISQDSQKDAVGFFKALPGLRALHLLDCCELIHCAATVICLV